jgi:rhodanese-related sulfurtransferase
MKRKPLFIAIATISITVAATLAIANLKPCFARSCEAKPATMNQHPKSEIEVIQSNLRQGALLVDVRTSEEFAAGHAQGAINLPYDQIVTGTRPTADASAKIYLYCRSGRRAEVAQAALIQAGYGNVANLISLENWQKLGGLTTK